MIGVAIGWFVVSGLEKLIRAWRCDCNCEECDDSDEQRMDYLDDHASVTYADPCRPGVGPPFYTIVLYGCGRQKFRDAVDAAMKGDE